MQDFKIVWTEAEIDALKRQLAAVQLPQTPAGVGWSLGCDRDFLELFRDYWINGYDWRAALQSLNKYPQFLPEVEGQRIHVIHVKGETSAPRPLLLTHGWPGSIFEFWALIEPLAFPSRHGGTPAQAFDLIIPSLPGYGYSGKPAQPIGPRRTAALWNTLMTDTLGYDRYLAQGGDWGGAVTSQIGLNHAPHVKAIHLNMLGAVSLAPLATDEERAWAQTWGQASQQFSGYAAVQGAKPLSLAWLSAGNPLGQAAWILERFHDWADLRQHDLQTVFGLDRLVTNIMLYVMPESFASSLWFYNGFARDRPLEIPAGERCETPTGFAACPGDTLMPAPPRSRIEATYNLVHWTELPAGGHFAAMEQPEALIADIRDWARKVW